MGAANSDDFSEHLEELQKSSFGTDIDCGRLGHQLHLVHDAVRTALPEVRQVTNIRTMCETSNTTPVAKTLLGEVCKQLRLYLTLPVVSATSERTFSTFRRLKNYLSSTMKQDRLKNCLLMHCHKPIKDTLDGVKILKRFACTNELRKGHFAKSEEWYALGLVYDESPTFQNAPPPLTFECKNLRVIFNTIKCPCSRQT